MALTAVSHGFHDGRRSIVVLESVDLRVRKGEFVAIVGPSGCGKTTLLNLVAGLLRPTLGSVTVDGVEVLRPQRSTGYMFARDALFPWQSAQRNVEFPLQVRGVKPTERRRRASEWLARVGLADFAGSYPSRLSQGMRQRVSMARTLATQPSLVLLDEPFAALDAQTKLSIEQEFVTIWEREGPTVLFVTHDLTEAILLADRVVVLGSRPGRLLEDVGIPLERPRNLHQARFRHDFAELFQHLWQALGPAAAGGARGHAVGERA